MLQSGPYMTERFKNSYYTHHASNCLRSQTWGIQFCSEKRIVISFNSWYDIEEPWSVRLINFEDNEDIAYAKAATRHEAFVLLRAKLSKIKEILNGFRG